MKKIFLMVAGIFFANALFAQVGNGGDSWLVPIAVVAASQSDIPQTVNTYIEDKLHQIVSDNGLGSSDYQGRFIITASIVSVSKDIVPGPPKQVVENLDITFYIVDNVEHKVFSSVTVPAKVVEASDEKALIKAIRTLNINNPNINAFVKVGRDKIVAYYSSRADQIIRTAKSLAKQRKFDEAFYELAAIPEECGEAYTRALETAETIYLEYVNYLCDVNLAKARAAWTAEQNANGATVAGEYLSQIYPDAKCYGEAQKLFNQIKDKVLDDWKFEIRKYEDGISLKKQHIQAWRAVGVAYGSHQQPVDYNINWLVR